MMPQTAAEKPKGRFSPDRSAVSCAGHGCADVKNCLKYRRHAAWIGQRWASFDIERLRHEGPCPAFERIYYQENDMKRKTPKPKPRY